LDRDDQLGWGVSLNAQGDRLAIGAPYDDGQLDQAINYGSVRLFTFADTNFSGGELVATIGHDYSGGLNIDLGSQVGFSNEDEWGWSVSLNAAGDRLAVGSYRDGGLGGTSRDFGAVRLFTFTDRNFGGGMLAATIGRGYSGGANLDLTGVLSGELFGWSVSLNALGNRLAVGAPNHNNGDVIVQSGSVRLFTFSDENFNGGALVATIGRDVTGASDIDLGSELEDGDNFGTSVSLNAMGDRLAVGSRDNGFSNVADDTGAVRLFTFTNSSFSGGALAATIGRGYTGGSNIDLGASLELNDQFGRSVSLNAAGDRLAVGAYFDDGFGNLADASGSVSLFTFSDNDFNGGARTTTIGNGYTFGWVSAITFADNATGTTNVSREALAAALASGGNITLQASNDITLEQDLSVNNPSGDGGDLTLEAGRSIRLNGSITTDNGDLTLIANGGSSDLATVNANRAAGTASITMASDEIINAGGGTVSISILDGAGLTDPTSGDIILGSITAGIINIWNAGTTGGSDVIVAPGAVLTAASADRAIDIRAATGTFINNAGSGAFSLTGGGHYAVFSGDPSTTTEGVTGYLKRYNVPDADAFAALNLGSSFFAYRIAPVLTVTANDTSRIFGQANPAFTYGVSGFIDGDTAGGSLIGAPSLTASADIFSDVGVYTIDASQGTLTSVEGYQFSFNPGSLLIRPTAQSPLSFIHWDMQHDPKFDAASDPVDLLDPEVVRNHDCLEESYGVCIAGLGPPTGPRSPG
jgi:hypothetical protein